MLNRKQKSYIIRAARMAWMYYDDNRKQCYQNAKVGKLYKCANCKKLFKKKECNCDHIVEIGAFIDWNTYMSRLFCPLDNLQILCIKCHKEK